MEKKLSRRQLMKTLGGTLGSAVVFGSNHPSEVSSGPPVRVMEAPESIEIDNGRVKARFRKAATGIEQEYLARKADRTWVPVVESFRAPRPRPEGTAPLYTDVNVANEYRLLAADGFQTMKVVKKTPAEVVVSFSGTLGRNKVEQTVSLAPRRDHFHVEVEAILAESPPRLEYLLSLFVFSRGASPDFTHVPCLKRVPDDVIGDRIFNSPATIIQKKEALVALVPDLDLINREVLYARDARPFEGPRYLPIPQDLSKTSMPTIMDLELRSGVTADPIFSFGFADFIAEPHMYWRHENRDGAMVRELSKNRVRYGFDLLLSAHAEPYRGYQQVSRHIWKRFGSAYLRRPRPQAMPLAEYAKVCYPAAFAYHGDSQQDTTRYFDNLPYEPTYSGPLPTWLEFEIDGRLAGGIRATPAQWYHDIQFLAWWNNVRDAMGMYWWGKHSHPSLMDKARRIVNLALAAPQDEGVFPAVYRSNEKRWVGCYWKFPENHSPHWDFPPTWDLKKIPFNYFDFNSDNYQTAAASKTSVYLLRYRRQCEEDPRIVPFVRRYADFLLAQIDPQGCVPAWITRDLKPVPQLQFNAEGGIHVWFLCELFQTTQERKYLDAAGRLAAWIIDEILPHQKWFDFETFYSCAPKPENFFDPWTGQWPQCSLSMLWAIDGLTALYQVTKTNSYLLAAEAVADYSIFSQASWQPEFLVTAYGFGGFRSQNNDAEWIDMRQAYFAEALVRLAKLTHRQDFYERGVAAARAQFAIINHPRHIQNDIFRYPRYPLGLAPENIDHGGMPQHPLRSGFDWGEGGGLTAAAELLERLGGAYIDFRHNNAVGVDGVCVNSFKLDGNRIDIDLENQLAALSYPYEAPYAVQLRIEGLPAGKYELSINSGSSGSIDLPVREGIRLMVGPKGIA